MNLNLVKFPITFIWTIMNIAILEFSMHKTWMVLQTILKIFILDNKPVKAGKFLNLTILSPVFSK